MLSKRRFHDAVLTFLALIAASSSAATSPEIWGNLDQGPYGVGFRVLERHDFSRPYWPRAEGRDPRRENHARPLQISVWYPATPAGSVPLTFGDYVELIGREVHFGEAPADAPSSRQTLRNLIVPDFLTELDDVQLDRWLALPTAAVREAPPAEGRFPLLLWARGEDGHAADHALLSEFLASHGFAVATTPALPAHSRRLVRHDVSSSQTQLRDLEFVIQALHGEPYVDPTRLGALAWSFGGLPAALLQMRHQDVAALVSLDARAGFRNSPELFVESPDYDTRRVTTPVLHLTGSKEPGVERLRDSSFFDALKYADVYRLTLDNVRHRDFNFIWGAAPRLAGLRGQWPVAPEEVTRKVADLTRAFLAAILHGDEKSRLILVDLAAGTPAAGISNVVLKAARPVPPSPDDFLWALEHEGIESAAALFHDARALESDVQLFAADELLRRCRNLLRGKQLDAAEALARLVLEAYPASTMSHLLLAQIATLSGDPTVARTHYARCLEILAADPDLDDGQKKLIRHEVEKQLVGDATG